MITKFQIETQQITTDGALRSARKNEQGWYPKIPVFIFNTDSRNGYPYDAKYVEAALTSPGKYFYEACRDAVAHSEYGHPDFSHCTTPNQVLMRMAHIDKTRMSHTMINGALTTGGNSGASMFAVDIKPLGPYADNFRAEMDDPTLNATFSARTLLVNDPQYHRIMSNPKKVDNVLAFDSVGYSGFSGASKRGQLVDKFTLEGYQASVLGSESIDVDMRLVDMQLITEVLTTENVTSGFLLDSLQANVLKIKRKEVFIGTFEDGDRSIHTHTGRASLIHALYHR